MTTPHYPSTKFCRKCNLVKPVEDFGQESRRPDGRRTQCKICIAAYAKPYRRSDVYKQKQQRYRQKDSYKQSVRRRKREEQLRYVYGITEDDYRRILESQGGLCAICRTDRPGGRYDRHFHVDHDHATGRVRGILCNMCNVVLGRLGDNLEGAMRFVRYLQENT